MRAQSALLLFVVAVLWPSVGGAWQTGGVVSSGIDDPNTHVALVVEKNKGEDLARQILMNFPVASEEYQKAKQLYEIASRKYNAWIDVELSLMVRQKHSDLTESAKNAAEAGQALEEYVLGTAQSRSFVAAFMLGHQLLKVTTDLFDRYRNRKRREREELANAIRPTIVWRSWQDLARGMAAQPPEAVRSLSNVKDDSLTITFKATMKPAEREDFEKSVGLPAPSRSSSVGDKSARFEYLLNPKRARFMAEALREHELVQSATASASLQGPVPVAATALIVPGDSRSASAIVRRSEPRARPQLAEKLMSFLERRHSKVGVRVTALERDRSYITLRIEGLRGDVIAGRKFWEQIDLRSIFFAADGNVQIHFIADGAYAAVISDRRPAGEAFRSMEDAYQRQLEEYLKAMTAAFQKFLDEGAP